jgi:hypothetical protein
MRTAAVRGCSRHKPRKEKEEKRRRPLFLRLWPARGGDAVRQELNVLALIKGNERYIYVYDDESRRPLIDAFRDQAASPHLSFTWFDAAVMTEKAREQGHATPAPTEPPSRSRIS